MPAQTDDLRIEQLRPLLPPAILMEEIPATARVSEVVSQARVGIADVLAGRDDRLVVVVGPCSIHDPAAALEYAERLAGVVPAYADDLLLVMRVYFEKPRTTVGWKGLINDPDLNGSFQINKGLRLARGLLRDIGEIGLPAATEFLDPISPQFIADLVSWGAIGARTTESQVHRDLASGLSMPVGFKNATDGGLQIAVDALRAAAHPHQFLSVTKQGLAAIVGTRGNPDCHVILRGGASGPNHGAAHVEQALALLRAAGQRERLMIDCSHGNSDKNPENQPRVAADIAAQIAAGQQALCGVMIESHLIGGAQKLIPGKPPVYGQSITDACLAYDATVPVLTTLAEAVRTRRVGKV